MTTTPAAAQALQKRKESVPQIKSRKATGRVGNPFVLLEGEEGAGKSTQLVLLSRSKRVGQVYALEVGETRIDEYGGLLPGCDVEILEHDGSYQQILEQVQAVKAEAQRAKDAGELPVVLGIDSHSFFWAGLCDWVNARARDSRYAREALAKDPNAEIKPGRNLWNDAESRYSRLQNQLMTFPGIVVVTARGKWVSMTDPATGQPYRDGRKEYRVESHKSLPYAVSVWVRLTRDNAPQVVACKSGHLGIRYEKDAQGKEANTVDLSTPKGSDLLDHLIFDLMKYDAQRANAEQLRVFTAGPLDESERVSDEDAAPATVPISEAERARRALVNAVWQAVVAADGNWAEVQRTFAQDNGGTALSACTDGDLLERILREWTTKAPAASEAGAA